MRQQQKFIVSKDDKYKLNQLSSKRTRTRQKRHQEYRTSNKGQKDKAIYEGKDGQDAGGND